MFIAIIRRKHLKKNIFLFFYFTKNSYKVIFWKYVCLSELLHIVYITNYVYGRQGCDHIKSVLV